MRKFNKFFLSKNSEVSMNLKKDQSYFDYKRTMDDYNENEYYKNKELFLEKYLVEQYKSYNYFVKKHLLKKERILSIGSGRCIPELPLINDGYNIICSDMEIPKCYEASKKIFCDYKYKKLNILKDSLDEKFNSVICFSVIYSFQKKELEIFFKKIYNSLEFNGLLIFDPGGCEDNLFSFIYNEIYLPIESYLIFLLSKLFGRQYFLFKKHNGYRFSNKELIKLAKENGFEFFRIYESDYQQEFYRSKLLSLLMRKFTITKSIFSIFGRLFPYVRIFKFKKINEKNI